ncbi:MAG TPA: phosphatidylserine decarboxylase [Candidatus Xenobia bacterium]|jgi:phosphatidylserine decarboxylase
MNPERRAWQEGLPYIVAPLATAALLWQRHRTVAAAAAAAGLACAAFFRDPDVTTEADDDDVVSAACGRVMAVDRVEDAWWIGGPADRIAVFLSITDVHVNRFPIAGRIREVRRIAGQFVPAMLHSENNCRDLLGLEGMHGRVLLAQISGLIARRSVQWWPVDEPARVGQRFGMIRFGSRTDVYLPAGAAQILVRPGDRVVGGITRIARYMPF